MKVLLAHNYYGSAAPSGENQVFEAEGKLLRQRGHEVSEFTRHSDAIRAKGALGALRGALSTPWNPFASKAIKQVVEDRQPDVVHVHNTFPLLSPAIFPAIGRPRRSGADAAQLPLVLPCCNSHAGGPCLHRLSGSPFRAARLTTWLLSGQPSGDVAIGGQCGIAPALGYLDDAG